MFVVLPQVDPAASRTVGVGFFPEDDRAEFIIALETPPGSNLEYTRLKARGGGAHHARASRSAVHVHDARRRRDRARWTRATSTSPRAEERAQAISVEQLARRSFAHEMKQRRRRDALGVHERLRRRLQADPVPAARQRRRRARRRRPSRCAQRSRKMPGAVDVGLSTKGQKPELEVELNRGVAGSLGVTVGQVAQSLRPAFAGIDAGDWVDPTRRDRATSTVRLAPESRAARDGPARSFRSWCIGPNGAPTTMPLGQVATIKQGIGPAIIDHLESRAGRDRSRLNTSGRATGDVTNDIVARVDEDARCRRACGSRSAATRESQAEVFGQIFAALGVAVLLMYLILVVQFGIVPRSAGDPDVAAAVADRRDARAGDHAATRSTS